MFHKTMADGFFSFSFIAVLAAMVGWAVQDIWLASTQWMLVAIFFVLVAVYVKINAEDDEKILKEKQKVRVSARAKKKTKHVSFRLTK